MNNLLNEYLTVKELADWVKLSKSHIYTLVYKNQIPYHKIGGKLIFDTGKIQAWIESGSNIEELKPKRKYKKKDIESNDSSSKKDEETDLVKENPNNEDITNSALD